MSLTVQTAISRRRSSRRRRSLMLSAMNRSLFICLSHTRILLRENRRTGDPIHERFLDVDHWLAFVLLRFQAQHNAGQRSVMKRDGQAMDEHRQHKCCVQDVNPRNFPPPASAASGRGSHAKANTLIPVSPADREKWHDWRDGGNV